MIDMFINNNFELKSNCYAEDEKEKDIRILQHRINQLEDEVQVLKNNFKELYKVFFSEELTNEK